MQNHLQQTVLNLYCDETKHYASILIQNSKFIHLFLNINLRIYLEDFLSFFRHDAFYKDAEVTRERSPAHETV